MQYSLILCGLPQNGASLTRIAAKWCFSSFDNQERIMRMKYFRFPFGGVRHGCIINIFVNC